MTIAAIETTYAGCRFRSRLEARWATFFDHLSIRWEYEPQGYEFDGQRYLPDFWLAEHNLAVEVKGAMDLAGARKIVGFAAHGHSVLILSDVPRLDQNRTGPNHWLVMGDRGIPNLWAVSWLSNSLGVPAPFPFGWPEPLDVASDGLSARLADPPADGKAISVGPLVASAYTAARSARFEHGETPEPRRSAPVPTPETTTDCPYAIGDWVEHDTYGRGVVSITEGSGTRATVTVLFKGGHVARFMMIPGVPLRAVA